MKITEMGFAALSKALQTREISAREAACAYLEEIGKNGGGTYLTLCESSALEQAESAQRSIDNGSASPLAGVPAAVADNICTKGVLTTCASASLANFTPPYDAAVCEKLNSSGAVMLGKTNIGEFGLNLTATKNAVMAGLAAYSIGSDAGGELRLDAARCGAVAMKPTYGGVSRHGLVALGSSLEQIGPLTDSVSASALVMNAIAGKDSRDATCREYGYSDFAEYTGRDIAGMKIAALPGFSKNAAATLEKLGAKVDEISISSLEYALPSHFTLLCAEISSNFGRFDAVRFGIRAENFDGLEDMYKKSRSQGFGDEIKRRLLFGTYALSSGQYDRYYKKAQQIRAKLAADFGQVFEDYDLMLAPVADPKATETSSREAVRHTVPANLAGLPALAMPFGGVSIQLIAKAFGERTIYQAAALLEAAGGGF